MGEFVFPETLKRMRNWNENENCGKREEKLTVKTSLNKSKNNFDQRSGCSSTNSCEQNSQLGQVWGQKFFVEMSFSQVC